MDFIIAAKGYSSVKKFLKLEQYSSSKTPQNKPAWTLTFQFL